MPRQARLDAPGVLHHIMARGIERGLIFRDDRDREEFLKRFSGLAQKEAWTIYAWSLMPNHFHLLVRTARHPLSKNMRTLMSGYAGYYNRRHKRHGHVFQNRYKSIVCEEEPYFLELVRYLHLNPVRSKIVTDVGGLDFYPYCGHSAIMGKQNRDWQDTAAVLGRFSESARVARRLYREFVDAGVTQGRRSDLTGGGLIRSHGGWRGIAQLRRGREKYRGDERVLGTTTFIEDIIREAEKETEGRRITVNLSTLMSRIADSMGVSLDSMTGDGRNRRVSRARAVLGYVWVRYLGRSGAELAKALEKTPQAIYGLIGQVERARMVKAEDLERWCK
jgi:putative transposase